MELYSSNNEYKLYKGSMLDMLEVIEPNSIDAIVTDPPYELNFMNKSWDNSGIAFQKETWERCFKVLKPGGYLLSFGGSRTYHNIACAIEKAGFEIRDCIMYLYGSGFPKSMNIGLALDKKNGVESNVIGTGRGGVNSRAFQSEKNTTSGEYEIRQANNEWDGWGTALKPAYEPIVVARKPVENSVIENVLKYGVGGININECRVGIEGGVKKVNIEPDSASKNCGFGCNGDLEDLNMGRFPANVIHDGSEEVINKFPDNENESASRFFYCAKASTLDRDEGLDGFQEGNAENLINRVENSAGASWNGKYSSGNAFAEAGAIKRNIHPTVKNTNLMRYLVRLVAPKNAVILDCFNGSGSTGKAVMLENKQFKKNYKYIGIELTEEYLPISKARIEYICNNNFDFTKTDNQVDQHKVVEKDDRMTIFDFEV